MSINFSKSKKHEALAVLTRQLGHRTQYDRKQMLLKGQTGNRS